MKRSLFIVAFSGYARQILRKIDLIDGAQAELNLVAAELAAWQDDLFLPGISKVLSIAQTKLSSTTVTRPRLIYTAPMRLCC
jgi:hypothetical protein